MEKISNTALLLVCDCSLDTTMENITLLMKSMGETVISSNQFHLLCWEMVVGESVYDHRGGNCNLDLDTDFTNDPDP